MNIPRTELWSFLHRERAVIFILIVLCLVLSATTTLYLAGERRHTILFLEYRIERASNILLETYRSETGLDDDLVDDITGFGIYDSNGVSIYSSGDAPTQLSPRNLPDLDAVFSLERKSSTMTMLRPIGMIRTIGMGAMGPRRPNMMTYLFVRIGAGRFYVQQALYTIGYVALPLFFATIFAIIGRLYYKNWLFKNRINAQKNLVHLGEAARTLAHEIRNPLSAVQIQTGILRKLLSPERGENLDIIDEEINRLSHLVDRIRDFLKQPTGEPEDVDAQSLVREIGLRYSWRIDEEADGNPPIVRIDRERFRSVLENLIRNAVEASQPGASILVRFETSRSSVHISILDRGTGIPEDFAQRLFDPFFTTKDTGSGIGLAISKRFVEAAGGMLAVRNRSGGGTVAKITFPVPETRR